MIVSINDCFRNYLSVTKNYLHSCVAVYLLLDCWNIATDFLSCCVLDMKKLRFANVPSCIFSLILGATFSVYLMTFFSRQCSAPVLTKLPVIRVSTLLSAASIKSVSSAKIQTNRTWQQDHSATTQSKLISNAGHCVSKEYASNMREMRNSLSRWLNKQTEMLYQLQCKTGKLVKNFNRTLVIKLKQSNE